jgi:hypothetical protein
MNLRRFVPILALLAMGTATMEASSAESDPFAKGRMGVSVYLGGGTAGSESYYTFGAGLSYYLVNGLWLGVSGETRQGIDPVTYKASPEIGYVFPIGGPVRPYVGAFYRRIWVENYQDFDTYGARAGVNVRMAQGVYFRIGAVYESLRDCSNTPATLPCSDTYGELGVLFGF